MWQYHPAYTTSSFSYDPTQGQFIVPAPGSMNGSTSSLATFHVPGPLEPRPVPGIVNDMSFWSEVFPLAMTELNKTHAPKQVDPSQWGIRSCSNWPHVQSKLEMARKEYDHDFGQEHVGKFRRKARHFLDKSVAPLQQIAKGVPSVDVASPIVSVATILLDVCRRLLSP